ncbi:MAG: hypothetical protein ACOX3W_06295 [Christensenellaceae bacterium]|jgi:hypothetical protein
MKSKTKRILILGFVMLTLLLAVLPTAKATYWYFNQTHSKGFTHTFTSTYIGAKAKLDSSGVPMEKWFVKQAGVQLGATMNLDNVERARTGSKGSKTLYAQKVYTNGPTMSGRIEYA